MSLPLRFALVYGALATYAAWGFLAYFGQTGGTPTALTLVKEPLAFAFAAYFLWSLISRGYGIGQVYNVPLTAQTYAIEIILLPAIMLVSALRLAAVLQSF